MTSTTAARHRDRTGSGFGDLRRPLGGGVHGKAGGEQAAARFRELQGDAVEYFTRLEGDAGDRCIVLQEHSRHVGGKAGDAQIVRRAWLPLFCRTRAKSAGVLGKITALLEKRLNVKPCAASSASVVPSVVRSLPSWTTAAWTVAGRSGSGQGGAVAGQGGR